MHSQIETEAQGRRIAESGTDFQHGHDVSARRKASWLCRSGEGGRALPSQLVGRVAWWLSESACGTSRAHSIAPVAVPAIERLVPRVVKPGIGGSVESLPGSGIA